MSSDEDYMSDTFLAKSIPDIRPGLHQKRSTQRAVEIELKKSRIDQEHRTANKSIKTLEQENRDAGLSSALPSDNKGFAMLARMGYKAGDALGKSSTVQSSTTAPPITEPIEIKLKLNRGGLGREAAIAQLWEQRKNIRMKRLLARAGGETVSTEEFRARMVQKSKLSQMESNIGKCQRACEKLDEMERIEQPAMPWFWPTRKQTLPDDGEEKEERNEGSEDEDELIEYEPEEKLEMLTNYLRTTYNFCHWCGTHYENGTDMMDNCPGPLQDDH